jgi:hypothetical protein
LGVEPKKPRLIYDARYINAWQHAPAFAFDSLLDLSRAADVDSLLTVWDHKSGYFHIRLHPDSEKYFGFEFEGFYYTYTVLPFGWCVSPYAYQKVSRAVSFYLRRLGIPDFVYLDDSATVSRPAEAWRHTYVKATLLTYLGYYVHTVKTALRPSPQQQWLGFVVDLPARTFRIPEDKLARILSLIQSALAVAALETGAFRSLVGKLVALAPAVPGALLYTRHLYDALTLADQRHAGVVTITADVAADLTLWSGLRGWHGTRQWRSERHYRVSMATDSSGYAWGGWFILPGATERVLVGDAWSASEALLDIGTKEMLAAVRAIDCFPPNVRDCVLLLEGDNAAMISLLRNGKAARGADLNAALKELFRLTMTRNIVIDASWLRSADNVIPDAISRVSVWGEGILSLHLFGRLRSVWGPFTLDAMAGAASAHCARFISRYFTPGCIAADVFTYPVGAEPMIYVFPPPPMTGAVLAYMREQRARGVIVVESQPDEPWWPLLRRQSQPIRLAAVGDTIAVSYPGRGLVAARFALSAFVCDFRG